MIAPGSTPGMANDLAFTFSPLVLMIVRSKMSSFFNSTIEPSGLMVRPAMSVILISRPPTFGAKMSILLCDSRPRSLKILIRM